MALLKQKGFDYMCVSRSSKKTYTIDTQSNPIEIKDITWQKKKLPNNSGYYLLRTTLSEKDEHTQWQIYNTIREIEATFRVLKTDLDLRPIFHKTEKARMAHLHLGLLAYWVVNTIRHQLKQKGTTNEWRDITRIMNTQKMVTTTMKNEYEQEIIIRQCSEPDAQVKQIYQTLNYKSKPFSRRKFVVPTNEIVKPLTQLYRGIESG